jgi:hypothetical protein
VRWKCPIAASQRPNLAPCQGNLAPEPLAGEIGARMARLCAELGTETARAGNGLAVEL